MKKTVVFAVVMALAGFQAGWAETVSFQVPALSVQTADKETVPGSGRVERCSFTFTRTTNSTPGKVTVAEKAPSKVGDELRANLWLAAITAALTTNRDLGGVTVDFETSGQVDGQSVGGAFCLAVMSALEGRQFPNDFAMTGTVLADGTVGPVGGVAERIKAASKAGIKRVCISGAVRIDEKFTDLLELAKQLKVEVYPIATITEAYRILYRLPAPRMERLNLQEVCRLPATVEGVLKGLIIDFLKDVPEVRNEELERILGMAVDEYGSGLFGASALDLLWLFDTVVHDSLVEAPDAQLYPELVRPYPTNETVQVDAAQGAVPSKKKYVEALKTLHRNLKQAEVALNAESDEAEKQPSWFNRYLGNEEVGPDDYVESPSGVQAFDAILNRVQQINALQCNSELYTQNVDAIEDWDALEAASLNSVRQALVGKHNTIVCLKAYIGKTKSARRMNDFYHGIRDSIPYMKPNSDVCRVEDEFSCAAMAMKPLLMIADGDYVFPMQHTIRYTWAEKSHTQATNDAGRVQALVQEVNVLSSACVQMWRKGVRAAGSWDAQNAVFFNSAVSTVRENALVGISECRKLGIPCVMPVLHFQWAETRRDAALANDAMTVRLVVLEHYLTAWLSAKVLSRCFAGQKIELNAKGYCTRRWTIDRALVGDGYQVNYRGIGGEPVLLGGYSGQKRVREGEDLVTCWLDLKGRDAWVRSSKWCYTLAYDALDRRTRLTYCDDSGKAKPRADGVLFETYAYDTEGNKTTWEFHGASSNLVCTANGVAVVRMQYNPNGQEIRRRFFDVNGKPAIHKDGSAGIDTSYDGQGNIRKTTYTYVDNKGKPIMTTLGYAVKKVTHYMDTDEFVHSYYDTQGRLVGEDGERRQVEEK